MLTNNYSFNSPTKLNQNNNDMTIATDDKFINLINNLSELIKKYYYSSKNNNDELIQTFSNYELNYNLLMTIIKDIISSNSTEKEIKEFLEIEEHLNVISPLFQSNLEKNKQNLKLFIEEAKEIFKNMKYRRYEKIYNMANNKAQLIKKKYDYSTKSKNRNNMETYRINDIRTSSKLRNKDDSYKLNNNTFNTNINNSSITNNIENLKFLIKKFNDFNDLIGNISYEAKETYIKLQNDINYELKKLIFANNDNIRKSFNNQYDTSQINNYSFNHNNIYSNDGFVQMKKTLFRDYSNNKSKSNNNINNNFDNRYEELKQKNNFYKNQIKDLEFQVEDLQGTIKVLEKTLEDSNNQLDSLNERRINSNNVNLKNINFDSSIECLELKKKNNNLVQKLRMNELQIIKVYNELSLLKKENLKYKQKSKENFDDLNKHKEIINNLKKEINELKDLKENKNKNDNSIINKEKEYLEIIENNKNEINLKEKKLNKLNEELNKQKTEFDNIYNKLTEENNILSQSIKDKNKEIEDIKNKYTLQNNETMNNKDEEITKLKEKIKENELKISNSNKYINELRITE